MVFSEYTKQRILFYYRLGYKAYSISKKLRSEGITASRRGVLKMIRRYQKTDTIKRKEGSGRPTKITAEVKEVVERQMRLDDETTAIQLYSLCCKNGFNISLTTILRARTALGWTFRGSAYCQLIRDANKVKRFQWAKDNLHDSFYDVIWTDECSVQMESHRRHCCRKVGEAPRPKPRCVHYVHGYNKHLLAYGTYMTCNVSILFIHSDPSIRLKCMSGQGSAGEGGLAFVSLKGR